MLPSPFRICLKIYAGLALFAAALHGYWHWLLPRLPEMQGLTTAQWQLLALFNWSIALMCLFFAAVAWWSATSPAATVEQVRVLLWAMASFWTGRFVLELVFPVQLPLLTHSTSAIIKLLLAVGVAILLLPVVLRSRARMSSGSTRVAD